MRKKTRKPISLILTSLAFLLLGILSFTPVYGGPETLGPSPQEQIRSLDTGSGNAEFVDETAENDAELVVVTTDEKALPTMMGQVSSTEKKAIPLRLKSGFDAFNTHYGNQWRASFSEKTGKVKVLYGASSKRYENGPERVAKGFLGDAHMIFGLKQDLSDLKTLRVDKTPERDHVRFQQTYNNIPIVGALVLAHSTPRGQVTMVQNGYIQGFEVANQEIMVMEAAKNLVRNDLQASLGKGAILPDGKVEKLIAPHKEKYYYVWKIAIPTQNPWGYWVYHVDAATGEILYKGNEILSLKTGQGSAYTSNANWDLGKISNVFLKSMFTSADGLPEGYLWGLHAWVLDSNGNDPYAPDFKFRYDPYTQKEWFDATHAYYKLNTIWDWWNNNVVKRYTAAPHLVPYFSEPYVTGNDYPIPTIVNVDGLCNAGYTPDIDGYGDPGFIFGNQNSCAPGSEDLVIDDDVVRHEYAHAMMDWLGFDNQFSGPVDYYGRAMGEGNADWFGFLNHTKDPRMGTVAGDWTPNGYLRNLDNTRMYPWDVDLPNYPVAGQHMPEEHYAGEIWGGYLYDLYRVLGASALKYVYNSFHYFDPSGGLMDGYPDFMDAIGAQFLAEHDLTGRNTLTSKAWGSITSRGLSRFFEPYCHPTNYFGTGSPGCDLNAIFSANFPPNKTINTKGNLLLTGNSHHYIIQVTQAGLDLTATVTGMANNGIINPYIYLYDASKVLWTSVGPSSSTKAMLKYPNLPSGFWLVLVTGTATAPARGYYNFKLDVK
jgi:hypothetical protein